MYPTILERLKQATIPPERFEYVEPTSVNVLTANPKWTWVARVCHEIPEGKCIMIPVTEGYTIQDFSNHLRMNLGTSRTTRNDRFSVRRSKDGKSVIVFKAQTWQEFYKTMESGA